jgi:O-methyltransferase
MSTRQNISLELLLKKQIKGFVVLLERILPGSVFNAFYKVSFPVYKELVRWLYLLKEFVNCSITSDKNRWAMVKSIFRIMRYSLVGVGGLEVTYKAVKNVCESDIPGDIVELGVARGGCSALMARVMFDEDLCGRVQRKLWLFDSYEGLPDPTDMDFNPELGDGTGDHVRPLPKGSCLGQLDEVQNLMFKKNNFPKEKIKFIKGWFDVTVPVAKKEIQEIAILRIDGDWYESTKCCLANLYDKVVEGGYILVDDYQSCYGCRQAVDEFIKNRNFNPDIKLDGRGGCYFEKV